MKATLTIFLLMPFVAWGQIQISDDFTDGNFSLNPTWIGDTAFFEITSSFELQLKDSIAGTRYLSTASGISQKASWEFYLRMDFNPSGSNYAKVYLMSDQQDLNSPLNGYFVGIGGSSGDRISLYRQSGTHISLITESGEDWVDIDPVEVRVKVERNSADLWSLSADTAGGSNFQLLGSAVDSSHDFSTHFGVAPQYTVTRSDKFFFDDFSLSGEVFQDTLPPKIEDLEVQDSVTLILSFSESLDSASATDPGRYSVNQGIGNPASSITGQGNDRLVQLTFAQPFTSRTSYKLTLTGVEDRFGNALSDSLEFMLYKALPGDVVINELMADPSPVVGLPPDALPEREYIEVFNRSGLPVNLKDWILEIGNSAEILPDYHLAPDSFVVITKDEGVAEFAQDVPLLGLDMSGLALVNGGTTVSLVHPSGVVLSSLSYSDNWYKDPNKSDGGWSLEQIDPDNRCGGSNNWRASEDPIGGTPGRPNSILGVNPDTTRPEMLRVSILGDSSALVHFSENLEDGLLADEENYVIHPELVVLRATPVAPGFDKVELQFSEALDPDEAYFLTLEEFPEDCSGNPVRPDTLLFGIPAVPEAGDLLINEVLFDPPSGGSDFVEIYNHSEKIFDLSKLRLGNWDAAFQTPVNLVELLSESFLIEPGRYLALTEDVAFLQHYYDVQQPQNLVEVLDLPSLPNDQGSVVLTTSSLQPIESFEYSDDLHLAVLDDPDGVSLERLSFDKAAGKKDNWHSAAATAGFATPGYRNSQSVVQRSNAEIKLQPKVFSPNQDAYNDLLGIHYSFDRPGNVVNLSIWSSAGHQVRELQKSASVETEGFFTWDGTGDNGQLLNSGIYIVVFDYFNPDGEREVVRKTCVLSL